ncbi:MAG: 3-deoxy-D-manno-octulosonic acid transferase [Rhodospirillales bacterium RIFCSPLOWO2_12_FULL_58_28]|nr:MAG: 3-deoxy-D-manno-octulosonic acid transferase [Rhodospirillales bacterium RIFCSPLOWO2_02_FULL_58_16]OHC78075.1 MAG: 3-deoxy-D-manno-octulosonic acid transferase [Rhodospirillales bacterium RIFCSPLOWO2_12_FULL_58_28]
MNYSDYIIYVDESGDHGLESIDQDYPVFVLNFCIFHKDIYTASVVPKIQAFKFAHFGHDLVILHEHDIRKQKPPYVFLQNQARRAVFMDGLNRIIEDADFTIIAAVIDKMRLSRQYAHPGNPYEIALCFCMEQAYAFLKDQGQHFRTTYLVVERRGKREDDDLELAFRRIRDGANRWGQMPGFQIVFADKKINSSGLQIADLTARPVGRHAINPKQPNRAWDIVETKLRKSPAGETTGWGLKNFP